MLTRLHSASCEAGKGESIDLTISLRASKIVESIAFDWPAGSAPTTSEDVVVKLVNPQLGSTFDVEVARLDPSSGGLDVSNLVLQKEEDYPSVLAEHDGMNIVYPNTDDLAVSVAVRVSL